MTQDTGIQAGTPESVKDALSELIRRGARELRCLSRQSLHHLFPFGVLFLTSSGSAASTGSGQRYDTRLPSWR